MACMHCLGFKPDSCCVACAGATEQQFSQASVLSAGTKSGLTQGCSIQSRSKTAAATASHSTAPQPHKRIKVEDTASSTPAVSRKKSSTRRQPRKAACSTEPQSLPTEAAATSTVAAPRTKKSTRTVIKTDCPAKTSGIANPSCKRKRVMATDTDSNIEPAKKKSTATKSNKCGTQPKVSTRSAANQSSQGVSGNVKVAEVALRELQSPFQLVYLCAVEFCCSR